MIATPSDFTFINALRPYASQHAKQLQNSRVRAHTARIHHKRRVIKKRDAQQHQKQKAQSQQCVCSVGTTASCPRCYHLRVSNPTSIPSSPDDENVQGSMSIHMPTTVKIYLLLFAPNVQALCEVFGFPQIWSADVLAYSAKGHCFAAFCAVMQSAHDTFTGQSSLTSDPSPKVLRYRTKAIEQLRNELDCAHFPDDSTLIAVLYLAILAGRLRDKAQREIHRQALAKLVRLRGGLSQVDRYTQSWLLLFEAFWALETGHTLIEKPVDKSYMEPPITKDPAPGDIRKLPSGLRTLTKTAILSPKVINALIRTNELLKSYSQPKPLATNENFNASYSQAELWDTVAQFSDKKSNKEPTLDTLLHLGLLLFNYLALSSLPPWHIMTLWTNMGRWVRKELTQRLLTCIIPRRVAEERCLLWLTSVAAASWQTGKNELSIEGEMLVTFAKQRFVQVLKDAEDGAGAPRATDFFECEKLRFDVAGYKPEGG